MSACDGEGLTVSVQPRGCVARLKFDPSRVTTFDSGEHEGSHSRPAARGGGREYRPSTNKSRKRATTIETPHRKRTRVTQSREETHVRQRVTRDRRVKCQGGTTESRYYLRIPTLLAATAAASAVATRKLAGGGGRGGAGGALGEPMLGEGGERV